MHLRFSLAVCLVGCHAWHRDLEVTACENDVHCATLNFDQPSPEGCYRCLEQRCTVVEGTQTGESCHPDIVPPVECWSDAQCTTSMAPLCNLTTARCVPSVSSVLIGHTYLSGEFFCGMEDVSADVIGTGSYSFEFFETTANEVDEGDECIVTTPQAITYQDASSSTRFARLGPSPVNRPIAALAAAPRPHRDRLPSR